MTTRLFAALTVSVTGLVLTFNPAVHAQDSATANEKIVAVRVKAEQGDANAQAFLGVEYSRGMDGFETNVIEAAKWYRKAAEQNSGAAQFQLAMCYALGSGVIQNKTEEKKWLLKAAEQKYYRAYSLLAIYYEGNVTDGTNQVDLTQAAKWYRKAVADASGEWQWELEPAKYSLDGFLKRHPEFTGPTYEQTLDWLKKTLPNHDCTYERTWKHLTGNNIGEDDNTVHFVKHFEIEKCDDGFLTIYCGPENNDERYSFSLNSIERFKTTTVRMNCPAYRDDIQTYTVQAYCIDGKEAIHQTYKNENGNWAFNMKTCDVFISNDLELANRVTKAFNHLLELPRKDDLFK